MIAVVGQCAKAEEVPETLVLPAEGVPLLLGFHHDRKLGSPFSVRGRVWWWDETDVASDREAVDREVPSLSLSDPQVALLAAAVSLVDVDSDRPVTVVAGRFLAWLRAQ